MKECVIISSQEDGRGIEMSQGEIETLLAGLQTPMPPKNLFEDYLQEAWELFQLPGDPDLPQFEAFLINAVLNEFKEADRDEDEAKNRDACLVGLGLLVGCYHTKISSGVPTHCKLGERCISYLSGDYVKLQYPNAQAGKNLNIKDRKSAPRQALDRSEKRNLKRLAAKLASMKSGISGSYQDCLRAGIEKHTELVIVSEGNGEKEIRKIILPQPCYTLEHFLPKKQKPTPDLEVESGVEMKPEKYESDKENGTTTTQQSYMPREDILGETLDDKQPTGEEPLPRPSEPPGESLSEQGITPVPPKRTEPDPAPKLEPSVKARKESFRIRVLFTAVGIAAGIFIGIILSSVLFKSETEQKQIVRYNEQGKICETETSTTVRGIWSNQSESIVGKEFTDLLSEPLD